MRLRKASRRNVDEQGFFDAERKKTDKDLTNERNEMDTVVEHATVALTTRDEFLAIVSHDLRNPLSSKSMAAQLLMDSPLYLSAEKEIRECVDIIDRSSAEALRIIGDLMDMECIAAGKLGLHIEPCNILEIIDHSIKSFQHLAAVKNISLLSNSENNGIKVPCDRDRISQVLSNLIGNAIKFTPDGGTITLAVKPNDHAVQISVTDTGSGIPQDMHKLIFERFWQIGKRDRRGLGLYISKMIVEAHHGQLWVESKLGQGSVFYIALPLDS